MYAYCCTAGTSLGKLGKRDAKLRRKLRFRRNGAFMRIQKSGERAAHAHFYVNGRAFGTLLLLLLLLLASLEHTAHHRYA